MRVLVDARPALDPRPTGVGRYARRMVEHLPAAMVGDTVVAWYLHARGILRRPSAFAPVANLEERPSRFPARVYGPLSRRTGFPRVESLVGAFDALLATNFVPPPTRSPGCVPVVHDLAFLAHPETAPQVDERYRGQLRAALADARAIIVPSEAVRDDLIATGWAAPGSIHVVAHGVDPIVAPADAAARLRRLGVGGRYLLFVGGIEPRKNLVRLVEAFARVETDATLVIAGGPVRWYPGADRELGRAVSALADTARPRVVLTGYVDDDDRAALLAGASALAYPSLAEGFGLPVLEAMSLGVPVLTADRSALPEVAGDAALLVDPEDVGAIAGGIGRILGDGALAADLASRGRARVAGFSWTRSAEGAAAALRAAAAR